MITLTLKEYNSKPADFRGVWTTERHDLKDWEQTKHLYIGKRTLLSNDNGSTVLLIEGIHFTIIGK